MMAVETREDSEEEHDSRSRGEDVKKCASGRGDTTG